MSGGCSRGYPGFANRRDSFTRGATCNRVSNVRKLS